MAWLVEAYTEGLLEEVNEDSILTEASDPVRAQVVKEASLAVKQFVRENGIKLSTFKAFINRQFKKGNSNDIVIAFTSDTATYYALGILLHPIIAMVYNAVVLERDMPKIKELLSDSKKKNELNKLLKETCSSGVVTVKEFIPSKQRIVLTYKEKK